MLDIPYKVCPSCGQRCVLEMRECGRCRFNFRSFEIYAQMARTRQTNWFNWIMTWQHNPSDGRMAISLTLAAVSLVIIVLSLVLR